MGQAEYQKACNKQYLVREVIGLRVGKKDVPKSPKKNKKKPGIGNSTVNETTMGSMFSGATTTKIEDEVVRKALHLNITRPDSFYVQRGGRKFEPLDH
jgi:hypothetical protein